MQKHFRNEIRTCYLFNCVMHLDEATPHLHIDYIPVAHGYKTGMETRNSLTKALQQMGFAKAVSKKENETVAIWCLVKGLVSYKTKQFA